MRGMTVAIDKVIAENPEDKSIVVVHGDCPTGADAMAEDFVLRSRAFLRSKGYDIRTEKHPADWNQYGRAAGPRRNKEMIALGADVCLAFNRGNSRGTSGTMKLAEEAGIEVLPYTAR